VKQKPKLVAFSILPPFQRSLASEHVDETRKRKLCRVNKIVSVTARYEMRSSGFHKEVRRHNELLRQRPSWQELFDYRTELEGASRRYRGSLTPHDEVLAAVDDDEEPDTVDAS